MPPVLDERVYRKGKSGERGGGIGPVTNKGNLTLFC